VRVIVVAVGKMRGELADAVRVYERRAGRYWKLEVIEVPQASARTAAPAQVKDAEAQRILARIPTHVDVVALTRDGARRTSTRGVVSRRRAWAAGLRLRWGGPRPQVGQAARRGRRRPRPPRRVRLARGGHRVLGTMSVRR